ncbi:DsbA family protein [Neorhizobium tomejilense]|uniref:DsbA family protein n=1 Tax=Neorhizobium tomejilense TaxID=2093828 RepID=UPI003ED009CC
MAQTGSIIYLFDPLCGWCYGAAPVLERLRIDGFRVEALATGLFSGYGARPMDAAFAAYAWTNDQRIHRLSGQPFSAEYRANVLNRPNSLLDSSAATLAITAAGLDDANLRFDALKIIQHARYVDGLDVTSPAVLIELLDQADMTSTADLLREPSEAVFEANRALVGKAQHLFRQARADGVPVLVVESGAGPHLLNSSALFGSYGNLMPHLEAA